MYIFMYVYTYVCKYIYIANMSYLINIIELRLYNYSYVCNC